MANFIEQLQTISIPPADEAEFEVWLELDSVVALLGANASDDELVLYAGLPYAFLHAILVPSALLDPPDVDDLMSWDCNASSTWDISYSLSGTPSVSLRPPLDRTRSRTLDRGERLVYVRSFEGHQGEKSYFEILQRFIHVFGLHFMVERNAYCRLDENGDLEDFIRIVKAHITGQEFGGRIVMCRRSLLDEYMLLTDSAIVQTFDFTRLRPGSFGGWPGDLTPVRTAETDIAYDRVVVPRHASFLRGYRIIRPRISKSQFAERLANDRREKEHTSFIAYDWKNRVVREISCAPGYTANYFTESNLPLELSPAFFRPEVLIKYKSDSAKYQLTDRSISCRGAWHLENYDINEAGQVHTYIVYLSRLPYREQLYWRSFNEEPKGPISTRAFKTDIEGSWNSDSGPLSRLVHFVTELGQTPAPWWNLRSAALADNVHYPVTASANEWANEILNLDQLLVEGLEENWIRRKAQSLGSTPQARWRSLKLIEVCLIAAGCEEDQAREITSPLNELHHLRSKLKGHAAGNEAVAIRKKVLADHGSYKVHFHDLVTRCDESFRKIRDLFGEMNP